MVATTASVAVAATALLVVAFVTLLMLRYYLPLRTTPPHLLLSVFLAVFLSSSLLLLVPVDLASAGITDPQQSSAVWLPERAILVTWRIAYWLCLILTWFILPLLGEYFDSGYIETRDRILYSIRVNVRYYLTVLAIGIGGLVYFVWENGFHMASLISLIMALTYAWGLILAIGLMGHGLIALPRRMFINAPVSRRLRNLQSEAPKIKERLDDARSQLEELENTVLQLQRHKRALSSEQSAWIDDLADGCIIPVGALHEPHASIPGTITDRFLADITRKLKRARHRFARFDKAWYDLCQRAHHAQTILDSATSRKLQFQNQHSSDRPQAGTPTTTARYYFHMHVIPYMRIALSGLLAIASVLVAWSEFTKSFAPSLSAIGALVVSQPRSGEASKLNFGGQLSAAAWLIYMDVSALYAISEVKVWGNRALVKRQTYAESACWYAVQVAKLTVPLSYNFVTMMPSTIQKQTVFNKFLGHSINLTPLGMSFNRLFPSFLLIPMLASAFNLYGKIKRLTGYEIVDDDNEDGISGFEAWREGRVLIEQELQGIDSGAPTEAHNLQPGNASARILSVDAASAGTLPQAPIRANRRVNAVYRDDPAQNDDTPRHFYQDLGERISNTFDTLEAPEWIRNVGNGFKKPKWLQGGQSDGSEAPTATRWFGGGGQSGGIRL